jgi:hypothetical protein
MKTKHINYRLLQLLTISLVAFLVVGCEKSYLDDTPEYEKSFYEQFKNAVIPEPCTTPLIAGQNIEVGYISSEFSMDGETLTVQYWITDPDWCITETHLDVQYVFLNIPQTKKGNPKVGQFAHSMTHDCVTFWEEEVDLTSLEGYENGETVYIAAHAVVEEHTSWCADFESYDEYDQIESIETDMGNLQFYMTDYSILEGTVAVGDVVALEPTGKLPYVAEPLTTNGAPWENIVGFTVGYPYQDDFVAADPHFTGAGGNTLTDVPDFNQTILLQHAYSNFEAIVMDFTDFENLEGISFAGVDPDHNEVWTVLYADESNTVIYIDVLGPYPSGQDGHAIPIGYDNPGIAKVVIWGNMNLGVPGRVGFAIDNVCANVVREETAWGEGEDFPGNNWAMYFTCTPDPCIPGLYATKNIKNAAEIYKINQFTGDITLIHTRAGLTSNTNINGNAWSSNDNVFFYTTYSTPNNLYFYNIGNNNDGDCGQIVGTSACGTFYNGHYYYVANNTNKLYKISFTPGWAIDNIVVSGTLGRTMKYGDIAVDPVDGMVYGIGTQSTTRYLFKANLDGSGYSEIATWSTSDHNIQPAFGMDGILYGVDAVDDFGVYKINKTNGELTPLSNLTISMSDLAMGPCL